MKILGSASYTSKSGKRLSLEGVGTLPDELDFKSLKVEGTISFDSLTCEHLKVEGECTGETISADEISIAGTSNVKSIKAGRSVEIEGTIKAVSIECNEISICSQSGKIEQLQCKSVRIYNESDKTSKSMFGFSKRKNTSRVWIKNIRAERVELQNCEAEFVECKTANVRANCIIEKLIVEGDCEIATDSKVSEVVRD